jgi:hypothetical protein
MLLNTKPCEIDILKLNVKPGAKVKNAAKFRPYYDGPKPEPGRDKKIYGRLGVALALQYELERRFVVLCEELHKAILRREDPDGAVVAEAIARFKEVFYLLDVSNVPPNFIYNTPSDYCKFFHISEAEVIETIHAYDKYLQDVEGITTADKTNLQDYLRKLNNEI